MSDLLDASVWVPLAAPDHAHHARSHAYWFDEAAATVLFCRLTTLAFLRHVTNQHIMRHGVLTCGEAWDALEQWLSLPEVKFAGEPDGTTALLGEFSRKLIIAPALWTDAYLAAFAIAGRHRLVTFDGDFRKFPGLDLLYLQP